MSIRLIQKIETKNKEKITEWQKKKDSESKAT